MNNSLLFLATWLHTDPGSRVSSPTLTKKKLKSDGGSAGSVSPGPLPLINHSNYLPQPPGMCRKGSATTTAEVRNALRSGWQRQHQHLRWSPTLTCIEKHIYIWTSGCAPLQLTAVPFWFASQFGIYQKLGQPSCLSVRSGYFTRTFGEFGGGGQVSIAYSNLEPLILFC